jgi:hypothetical protein
MVVMRAATSTETILFAAVLCAPNCDQNAVLGPEGAPGSRFAFFEDPDGNGWAVQELKRS